MELEILEMPLEATVSKVNHNLSGFLKLFEYVLLRYKEKCKQYNYIFQEPSACHSTYRWQAGTWIVKLRNDKMLPIYEDQIHQRTIANHYRYLTSKGEK